jgi:hypothetical protein
MNSCWLKGPKRNAFSICTLREETLFLSFDSFHKVTKTCVWCLYSCIWLLYFNKSYSTVGFDSSKINILGICNWEMICKFMLEFTICFWSLNLNGLNIFSVFNVFCLKFRVVWLVISVGTKFNDILKIIKGIVSKLTVEFWMCQKCGKMKDYNQKKWLQIL